jgi:hypothetical protein
MKIMIIQRDKSTASQLRNGGYAVVLFKWDDEGMNIQSYCAAVDMYRNR